MIDATRISKIVSRVGDLPAMPESVSEVLRITGNPSASMTEVSAVVQSDPGMTAKILRVSNSSYYGMKQHVGTLKLALIILGVREVRNIVLGVSVFDAMRDGVDPQTLQSIWMSGLRTAGLVKRLGREMAVAMQGEEFIAGLLSNIGKLALYREFGHKYTPMHLACERNWSALLAAENTLAGCTPADIAAALAFRWNLPRSLADALWFQYPNPEHLLSNAADPELAALLRIAKLALMDDFSSKAPLACLADTEAWAALGKVVNPIPEGRRRELMEMSVAEVEELPVLPS